MFSAEAVSNIIRIALQPIKSSRHPLYTASAEVALLMVAAYESTLGKYTTQLSGGPARGLYQVEVNTMEGNYTNFLDYREDLKTEVGNISGTAGPDELQLQYNPIYGTIHARLKLYRSPGPLPPESDLFAIAEYLKDYYNTASGSATEQKYYLAYRELVLS